jgi:hypothetical protein
LAVVRSIISVAEVGEEVFTTGLTVNKFLDMDLCFSLNLRFWLHGG